MQAVAKVIPEPLNAEEHRIFSEMHLRQPHYGNLTLLLLGERLGFVESVVQDLCDRPGDRHLVAVLHRLLQFYAMMAPERRDADRERKRNQAYEFEDGRDFPSSREPTEFARIAAHILDVRGEGCPCAAPEWGAEMKSQDDPFTFEATCLRCDTRREVTLSRGEFAAFAKEVLHLKD